LRNECVLGLAAGCVAGLAMNMFAGLVSALTRGHEGSGAAPGADRVGRGMQPPQAVGRAEQDAAVRVGSAGYYLATGHTPTRDGRLRLGTAAHYAFSGALGVGYVLAATRAPIVTECYGTLYGTLVWAAADETAMPALGLSRGPRQLGAGVHAYALTGHWVYGATLEFCRRLFASQFRLSPKLPRRATS
jgi:uncharacterized membrane protein YagU involved in acid resistance